MAERKQGSGVMPALLVAALLLLVAATLYVALVHRPDAGSVSLALKAPVSGTAPNPSPIPPPLPKPVG